METTPVSIRPKALDVFVTVPAVITDSNDVVSFLFWGDREDQTRPLEKASNLQLSVVMVLLEEALQNAKDEVEERRKR